MIQAGPQFFLVASKSCVAMAQMDCYPTQAFMDSVIDVPRYPEPLNLNTEKKFRREITLYHRTIPQPELPRI